ncbi:hypothetical protein BBP40_008783 [Aspergillus hancockii]|nr:hypothetical protein BBP40_008783 [Aspergillus hancockii]
MTEPLLSVLTGESWSWDSLDANQITFNKDGTGKLICRAELNVWIAAEFDWKPHDPKSLSQPINITNASSKTPSLLGEFNIELALTKRRIAKLGDVDTQRYRINESLLTDAAFTPKTYTIRLEQGGFLTPFDARQPVASSPMFAVRLVFDKSPYPPREEWKEPDGTPDAMKFWEWREFCGRRLSENWGSSRGSIFSRIMAKISG